MVFVTAEGSDSLLVVRTLTGTANAMAIAIDKEEWPEILGTVAGDDTIFVAHRSEGDRVTVEQRLADLAGGLLTGREKQ